VREAEERARGTVAVVVSGAEGGRKDERVDDVGEDRDGESVHGDYVGRGCGAGFTLLEGGDELGVVVWNINPDCETA
jgi:hypothetical protein